MGCMQEVVTQLRNKFGRDLLGAKVSVTYNDKVYNQNDYDVMAKPVTVHIPLTRLAAGLLVQFGKLGLGVNDLGMQLDILTLAEHTFQTVSLSCQVTAGCWRRNGLSLANQVFYCRDNQCRAEAFDRDLQMLQLCAALADPDEFFVLLYFRLKLNDEQRISEASTHVLI